MVRSFDAAWEELHSQREWGRYPPEEVIRFVARNYGSQNRAEIRLLDAGCGAGAVTWYLAREGFSTYAFDGSLSAVEKAIKRLSEEVLKAEFRVADAACPGYPSEFFDGIIDSAMIYANTVPNIKVILKECHRMLKKGGKIFSTGLFKVGMTGYGTGDKLEKNTYRNVTEGSLADRGTVHFFTEEEIRRLWTMAGFGRLTIDSLERTELGGARVISYFMVEAEK